MEMLTNQQKQTQRRRTGLTHPARRPACDPSFRQLALAAALAILPAALPAPAQAPATHPAIPDRADTLPQEIEGLAVVENVNARLPLDLPFVDEFNKPVKLGDYFRGGRPVILNLGYYRCPMLCGLILNGLTEAMKGMEWTPGREFEVVTLSFDPRETPELAQLKKQNYIREYGRGEAAAGWHFLTGEEKSIGALCQAAGYPYRWNPLRQEYSHPAVLIVCTPDGRISRYLYGIQFEPKTIRLSLAEANEGKTVSTADQLILWCFHYDKDSGRYVLAAQRLMGTGGFATALVLALWLVPRWLRDRRSNKANQPAS